jgi:phosphoribosyl 1,2-cyclic phosphate phosphodiesterase
VPKIQFSRIQPGISFEVLGQKLLPIRLEHGPSPVLGFRIHNLAYCTDVSRIPDESWGLLGDLDTLVLDALRFTPHPTHFSLEEALRVIDGLKPRRTFFTHLSHEFDHDAVESTLPGSVRLAYDGLAVEF